MKRTVCDTCMPKHGNIAVLDGVVDCRTCSGVESSSSFRLCADCAVKTNSCQFCLSLIEADEKTEAKYYPPSRQLCYDCKDLILMANTNIGVCVICGTRTGLGVFRLCIHCAVRLSQCQICLRNIQTLRNVKYGAVPPENLAWQAGKTAASIAMFNKIESFLQKNPDHKETNILRGIQEGIKTGRIFFLESYSMEELLYLYTGGTCD